MTAPTVALVTCSNGFGHVRRMLLLALALVTRGAQPVLFAPAAVAAHLARSMGIAAPPIHDFTSGTDSRAWRDGRAERWLDGLPDLGRFDRVVSDNLIEILDHRPDSWLSGSFFWHRALDGVPAGLVERSEARLARIRPRMVSTALFAAAYLAASTRLHGVGLYALPGQDRIEPDHGHRDALIACGRGGGMETETATAELVTRIAAGPPPPFDTVWIEPGLHRGGMPAWMRPADFSPAMFARLRAAIVRPGIGTVTDTLLAGGRLFAFFEDANAEMSDNALRIETAGLGESCRDIGLAWHRATAFAVAPDDWLRHCQAVAGLDRNGADQAAGLILAET